jgi:hypothetical protein
MKHSAEFKAFDKLVGQLLSMPRAEILRREAEYKKQAALNPKRRGPKPKQKPAVPSHGPADQLPS